jgi:hypothetical protein
MKDQLEYFKGVRAGMDAVMKITIMQSWFEARQQSAEYLAGFEQGMISTLPSGGAL